MSLPSTPEGVLALSENPGAYQMLRDDPGLMPNMVAEILRWQTPLAHMRRTATRDTQLAGQAIAKGDKVVMWHVSANRDDPFHQSPRTLRGPSNRDHVTQEQLTSISMLGNGVGTYAGALMAWFRP